MITLENISLSFANKKLFENFNLKINRGDKILLYGKSGTGKSSLLKMLLGFQMPDSGKIYINGKISDQTVIWEFRKKVGYVSQDTDIGQGKINDLLEEILNYSNHRRLEPDRKSLLKYLEFFELPAAILEKDIADISGGEKQRIALIIPVFLQKSIFLLDEATAALDPGMKNKVTRFFLDHKEWTIIVSAHDREWLSQPEIKVIKIREE